MEDAALENGGFELHAPNGSTCVKIAPYFIEESLGHLGSVRARARERARERVRARARKRSCVRAYACALSRACSLARVGQHTQTENYYLKTPESMILEDHQACPLRS